MQCTPLLLLSPGHFRCLQSKVFTKLTPAFRPISGVWPHFCDGGGIWQPVHRQDLEIQAPTMAAVMCYLRSASWLRGTIQGKGNKLHRSRESHPFHEFSIQSSALAALWTKCRKVSVSRDDEGGLPNEYEYSPTLERKKEIKYNRNTKKRSRAAKHTRRHVSKRWRKHSRKWRTARPTPERGDKSRLL